MDRYSKEKENILKLFSEISDDSNEESEHDPFSDDGTFGDDLDYQPEQDDQLEDSPETSPEASLQVTRDDQVIGDDQHNTEAEPGDEIIQDYPEGSDSDSFSDLDSEVEGSGSASETELDGEWFENTKEIPQFNFDAGISGVQINLDEKCTPLDVFHQIFGSNIVDKIVSSTNAYGEKLCSSYGRKTRHARFAVFKPTHSEEMFKFLGLCLLQAQVKPPKIRDLFSNDPLYYHPIFWYTMTGRRFEQLLRCFSCSTEEGDETKLRKIQPLMKLFVESFQKANYPKEHIALNESLLLFRGRLSFRQYIKGKVWDKALRAYNE